MRALHSFLLISDTLLAIHDNEGFNNILSHFLHLKRKLLFSDPIKPHSDLLIPPFNYQQDLIIKLA